MKTFRLLDTDFYQISMATAYMLLDQANNTAGFEAFVRNIKPEVTDKPFYVFKGESRVRQFMETVAQELQDPEFEQEFIRLILEKLPGEDKDSYEARLKEKFLEVRRKFDYSVARAGSLVYPYIPVFQYRGPIWIGQLIETHILNIVNGKTGYATRRYGAKYFSEYNELRHLKALTKSEPNSYFNFYLEKLRQRAKEYRKATKKTLLEAGFRRAPGFEIALQASKIALDCGWSGTSNVAFYRRSDVLSQYVGGTMAHSFVMSQQDELTAFKLWNEVFPDSTILIDTYDCINAVKLLIGNNIKPNTVRIDSQPLDVNATLVRHYLDIAGWGDVKIFISGDITPEMLRDFEARNIPFDKAMAGTEYVNIYDAKKLNAGFVYKLVEVVRDGINYFPEKKANGKKNYSQLKTYLVGENGNVRVIPGFGLETSHLIGENATFDFSAFKKDSK